MNLGRPAHEFRGAIDALYSAGLGEGRWEVALDRLTRFVGGEGAVSFMVDRRDGRIADFTAQALGSGQDDYERRMHHINPRARYSLSQAGPHIAWDYKFLPEPAIRRHEFYDWLETCVGTRYFVGSRVFDEGQRSVLASVEFTARQGHPDTHHIERFGRLVPHVANAWRMKLLLRHAQAQSELAGVLQGLLPWGLVALDQDGRVLFMNKQAENAMNRSDGLRIEDGRLFAAHAAANRSLQRLIGTTVTSTDLQLPPAGGPLAVARGRGAGPLMVRVLPLPANVANGLALAVRALVLIGDPLARCEAQVKSAQGLFGLTPRETAVLLPLCTGHSLSVAASMLGMSHNTARAHLRSIFLKTGTHSQSQLVYVIARLWPA